MLNAFDVTSAGMNAGSNASDTSKSQKTMAATWRLDFSFIVAKCRVPIGWPSGSRHVKHVP